MDVIGLEQYVVTLPQYIQNAAGSRAFFSESFGGNRIKTFPCISEQHLRRHGYDHFMYASMHHNPHLPQVPGAAGLKFFNTKDIWPKEWLTIQKTIVRLCGATWLYVGEYVLILAPDLTKEEWLSQEPIVS